ncbi:MAG: hypothetical protein M1812_002132 [Candelaria pacifica]|nr:MAG: hypothetical protein M1812_002132 [Candelaria pacifica]
MSRSGTDSPLTPDEDVEERLLASTTAAERAELEHLAVVPNSETQHRRTADEVQAPQVPRTTYGADGRPSLIVVLRIPFQQRPLSNSAPSHDRQGRTTRTSEWFLERREEEIAADARLHAERLQNKQEGEDAAAAEAKQRVADEELAEELQAYEYEVEMNDTEDDYEFMEDPAEKNKEEAKKEPAAPRLPTLIPRVRRRLSPTPEPTVDRKHAKVGEPDMDKLYIRLRPKVKLLRYRHTVDWEDSGSVDKLNKWRQQVFRRKIGIARAPIVKFSDEENKFLVAEHKRTPMNSWEKITEDFNALFQGTMQIGASLPREERSVGSLRTQRGRIPEVGELLGKVYRPKESAARAARTSVAGPSMTRQERAALRAVSEGDETIDKADEGAPEGERPDLDEHESGEEDQEEDKETKNSPKGKGKERAREPSPRPRKRQRKS